MTDYATRRTMMVDTQVRPSDVTKFPIIDAMLTVPRERFVPSAARQTAYMGEHVQLAANRVVLDPRTFAKLLDFLNVQPHDLVLDIGTGLGYSAAVLSRLAEAVVAVEEDASMAAEAETALSEISADNVAVEIAPLIEGAAPLGPYDAIMIQGAVQELPEALTQQLKEGGRIACIFMSGVLGVARIGHKTDGRMTWRDAFNASAPVLPGFQHQPAFQL